VPPSALRGRCPAVERLQVRVAPRPDGPSIPEIANAPISTSGENVDGIQISTGPAITVAGIVQWDDHKIGNGKPGPIASALLALLEEDMRTGDRLIDVPY